MKRLVFDIDGTLTIEGSAEYIDAIPNIPVIQKLRKYKEKGFDIVLCTARNMRTHNNSIGKINAKTLPVLFAWLEKNDVPYDEIWVGKPWCGTDGFYIDDKAIRPSEFVALDYRAICDLVKKP